MVSDLIIGGVDYSQDSQSIGGTSDPSQSSMSTDSGFPSSDPTESSPLASQTATTAISPFVVAPPPGTPGVIAASTQQGSGGFLSSLESFGSGVVSKVESAGSKAVGLVETGAGDVGSALKSGISAVNPISAAEGLATKAYIGLILLVVVVAGGIYFIGKGGAVKVNAVI